MSDNNFCARCGKWLDYFDVHTCPPTPERKALTAPQPVIAPSLPDVQPVAWAVSCDGDITANIFATRISAETVFNRLNRKYTANNRSLVPLYMHPQPDIAPVERDITDLLANRLATAEAAYIESVRLHNLTLDELRVSEAEAWQLGYAQGQENKATQPAQTGEPRVASTDWYTIDSAPKDGRDIIIRSGGFMALVCWYKGEDFEIDFEPFWGIWDGKYCEKSMRRELAEPTHWTHAPTLPLETFRKTGVPLISYTVKL